MTHARSRRLRAVLTTAALTGAVALPRSAPAAQDGADLFTIEASGRSYARLQSAVDAIGGGEGTILIAPGTYRQCAVQEEGRVAFVAREPGTAIFEGTTCEGKAALVLRGEGARVEGLVFTGMAVPDYNGAGIRLENGPLIVSQSWFRDSQQGILTVNGKDSELRIHKSTFTRLGTCEGDGGCAHSIYAGDYGTLEITASRFEEGRGGHYVKSRTARTSIADSSFDDSGGRGTNYMIDLPNGGGGTIAGNWFVQGRDKENWSAFIAVGAEGASYSSDGLTITGNDARLAPGLTREPAFVADWTGDRLVIDGNRLGEGLQPLDRR